MKTKQKFKGKLFLIVIPVFIIFAFWAGLYPRTDVQGTTQLLKEQNYKPINVGGHAWFTGKKSWSATKFKAISSKGDTVTGYSTTELFGKSGLFFN